MENRFRHKNGSLVWINLTVSPARSPTGEPEYAIVVLEDITARKQAAEQMKRLDAESDARALMLATANRVAMDILAGSTGVEALRHIAEAARTLSGARYAALGVGRPGSADPLE